MGGAQELKGPDLAVDGAPLDDLADGGTLLGHAGDTAVLLVRRGDEVLAVGATCTHYGGPLAEGLVVGDQVRCPWHHACFDLRTGEAVRAPALNPIPCFAVERRAGTAGTDRRVFVGGKLAPRTPPRLASPPAPKSVVIVGGGAAGHAAAEMLRREGYAGPVTLVSADSSPPVDRPNLSKDYLAGTAPEEWIPLRPPEFYVENSIALELGQRVTAIDASARSILLADGRSLTWDALLLATGADPVRLTIPGANLPHVHTLRTLADSRAIIAAVDASPESSREAVVLGASFIGLEVAASLRARGVAVHVVAPDSRPLERVLGAEVGDWIRGVHEEKGVHFHLGTTPREIDAQGVTLANGERIACGLVVMGVGVRPHLDLAEKAGLATDRGVLVDEYLQTSSPGIWAAGDLARWPDPHTGQNLRVEHWVVAQRQGQTAARNMLADPSRRVRFDAVPFFWSMHYDVGVNYVGHAERWDHVEIDGSLVERSAKITYSLAGRVLAVATVWRDLDSLRAEAAMEQVQSESRSA